jgi:hypothetical protein
MSDAISNANPEKVDRRVLAAALKAADGNLKKVSVPRAAVTPRSIDEWARIITGDLTRAVEGIIAAGQNPVKARTQVPHGEWLPLLKRVGIGDRKAQRLMFIANNLRLANPTRVSHLPPCWGTLYELTKLAPDVLEAKIIEGMITPEITRAEVARLKSRRRPKWPTRVNAKPPPKFDPDPIDDKQLVRFEILVSPASVGEIDRHLACRPGVSRQQIMEHAVETFGSELRQKRLKQEARDWDQRQKYEAAMAEKRARGRRSAVDPAADARPELRDATQALTRGGTEGMNAVR